MPWPVDDSFGMFMLTAAGACSLDTVVNSLSELVRLMHFAKGRLWLHRRYWKFLLRDGELSHCKRAG